MRAATCAVVIAIACVLGLSTLASAQFEIGSEFATRMPGTQPNQMTNPILGIDAAGGGCIGCHDAPGINITDRRLLPGYTWPGSMMAQSARDPIWWACLTVALQDSIWAVNANGGEALTTAEKAELADICLRCHTPGGWLNGNSEQTNGALLAEADFDGVHCEFCHRLVDPLYETTTLSPRESADFTTYWDEDPAFQTTIQAGISNPGGIAQADAATRADMTLMNADRAFYQSDFHPLYLGYTENGAGQYFVHDVDMSTQADAVVRGPFNDPLDQNHQVLYSRYHKSKFFCATCHDVSNPAVANLGTNLPPGVSDGSGGVDQITEQYSAHRYSHVERTFSEFMLSDYAAETGAATTTGFRAVFPSITTAAKCQDCHMRDVTSRAADAAGVLRPTNSAQHPNSGMPHHDMTGGNIWMSAILASLGTNSANRDDYNRSLLIDDLNGDTSLTLDPLVGQGNPEEMHAQLLDGVERAKDQLRAAASVEAAFYNPVTGRLAFRVVNNTGHKLISGFLEGRRMWVNIVLKDDQGQIIQEVNPYDMSIGTIRGYSDLAAPGANEIYEDTLVYEALLGSSLMPGTPDETKTFHFALGDTRSKDNRIPPKGFDIAGAAARLSEPFENGDPAPGMFTAGEYAGGYDQVVLGLAPAAASVEIAVYYQGTSREYVEFLRDEINGVNQTLPALTGLGLTQDDNYLAKNGDAFFANLAAWGDVIWNLWRHNHGIPAVGDDTNLPQIEGITPFMMASATAAPTTGALAGPNLILLED